MRKQPGQNLVVLETIVFDRKVDLERFLECLDGVMRLGDDAKSSQWADLRAITSALNYLYGCIFRLVARWQTDPHRQRSAGTQSGGRSVRMTAKLQAVRVVLGQKPADGQFDSASASVVECRGLVQDGLEEPPRFHDVLLDQDPRGSAGAGNQDLADGLVLLDVRLVELVHGGA